MSTSPLVLRRVAREVAYLQRSPPEGIAVEVSEQDLLDVSGWIQGPAGTPYQGGYFHVHVNFAGSDFPAGPPRCTMRTKVFHPNIAANGEICVSTLKKDWSPSYGIEHILVVIKCLLISPNPDSALQPEAARLLQEAYTDYASTAAMWTRVHASKRPLCMPVDADAASTSRHSANARGLAVELEPTIASFQSLALHPHKRREIEAKAGPDAASAGLGLAAQPLRRSGSTNADLRHKSSFDIAARSGSGIAGGQMVPGPSADSSPSLSHEAVAVGKGHARAQSQSPSATSLNADTEHVVRRLRNVSISTLNGSEAPMCQETATVQPSAARPSRSVPVAIVRRGIKRL